jgi:signal transduction histidine kinase
MNSSWLRNFWRQKKMLLPLRLRLALWSGLLVLVISFALLLFINITALNSFPDILGSSNFSFHEASKNASQHPPVPPPLPGSPIVSKPLNPLASALLFELQHTSLIGLGLITILGSAGAYWLAGIALRPVREVSASVRHISANTLHTRLTLDGPQDEVKELADAFDIMLGRLQHTFELQNNFIGDIAHELRTPLTSIRTNL